MGSVLMEPPTSHLPGTCGLKVKKDYLLREFAPHGVQDTKRAGKIFGGMLSILGVDPRRVDLDALVRMKK